MMSNDKVAASTGSSIRRRRLRSTREPLGRGDVDGDPLAVLAVVPDLKKWMFTALVERGVSFAKLVGPRIAVADPRLRRLVSDQDRVRVLEREDVLIATDESLMHVSPTQASPAVFVLDYSTDRLIPVFVMHDHDPADGVRQLKPNSGGTSTSIGAIVPRSRPRGARHPPSFHMSRVCKTSSESVPAKASSRAPAHAGAGDVLGIVVARVGARAALVQVDFAVLDGVREVAADPQRPVVLAQRQAGASGARTIIHPLILAASPL